MVAIHGGEYALKRCMIVFLLVLGMEEGISLNILCVFEFEISVRGEGSECVPLVIHEGHVIEDLRGMSEEEV